MLDIARDIRRYIITTAKSDDLVFTGQLTDENSWHIDKQGDDSVVIGCYLLWARIQDEGRMPGKAPPMKALMPWVFQKIGAKDEKELKRIAYAISRKIAEKGIEPHHYIKRALVQFEVDNT